MPKTLSADEAQELAQEFHGRDNRETTEFFIETKLPGDLAQLGTLIELQVFVGDEGDYVPLSFAEETPNLADKKLVTLAATRKQLYFIGGDQDVDLEDFANAAGIEFSDDELEKDVVPLGEVKAIAYFADKHHLEGPKKQTKGIAYQHEFAINEETGEQIGEYPLLIYDQVNNRLGLVGGGYEVLAEGISG